MKIRSITIKIAICIFVSIIFFHLAFTNTHVTAQPMWPQQWVQIDWDANENGATDDWRDVEIAYYQQDIDYLYLKLQCYDMPGSAWPSGEGRYKWFIDLDGNMYHSGENIFDSEYVLFVEDTDDDGLGQMYLVHDTNGDGNLGEYEPWPLPNYMDFEVSNPNVGGWRIVSPNQIEMYISWASLGDPFAYSVSWATDQQNPNLDQSPASDHVDEEEPITINNVAAVSQTPNTTSVIQGLFVSIEVVIENQGMQTESFEVTCYFNTSIVGILNIDGLPAGHSATLYFDWNTTGVPPSTYAIKAWADSSSVITEIDEIDNWCTSPATVTIQGLPVQYYLTVISPYGVAGGNGWYDNNTNAYATLETGIIDHGNGTRRVFTSWSGDASGTNYATSDQILMDGPKTAVANWKTQYYLTLTSTSGGTTNPSGSAWYDAGTMVSVTAIPDTYYLLDHWELDSTPVGSVNPYSVIINTANTLHAIFVQETSTLTITVSAGGTTDPSPGTHIYPAGTYVMVTAMPEEHYVFNHWELDGVPVGSENPYIVFLNPDHTLQAVFTLASYTLTINSATGGDTNPAAGSYIYTAGTNRQVSATPDIDFVFDHWILDGGNAGSANPINVQMYANHELEPVFVYSPPTPPTHYLTVKTEPLTVTTVPGEGLYDEGENVVLTAPVTVVVSTGIRYRFTYWDIDGTPQGTGVNPITVYMDANYTATAHYVFQYYFTVTSPYGSPTPSSEWFDAGTGITPSVASPVSGPAGTRHVCTGWTGTGSTPASGTTMSTVLTINEPSSITWNWKTQYYLTIKTDPSGIATIPGQDWYDATTVVPLTAPSVGGYAFLNWDVDTVSQGSVVSSISVTMNASHTATAHYQLKVAVVGGSSVSLQAPLFQTWLSLNTAVFSVVFMAALWIKRRQRKD